MNAYNLIFSLCFVFSSCLLASDSSNNVVYERKGVAISDEDEGYKPTLMDKIALVVPIVAHIGLLLFVGFNAMKYNSSLAMCLIFSLCAAISLAAISYLAFGTYLQTISGFGVGVCLVVYMLFASISVISGLSGC